MKIEYHPIGIIHSPFTKPEGMPIQPAGAAGIRGTAELWPEYMQGLKDLAGFSHIILLYHFHQSAGCRLQVTPFMDTKPHGVFATRAPRRPNAIGLSIVKLLQVEAATLHIENVDVLDGTPLLDLKPYVPDFDKQSEVRVGWLEGAKEAVDSRKSDARFTRQGGRAVKE